MKGFGTGRGVNRKKTARTFRRGGGGRIANQ
jgi:hypothetical protein